jgi:hypothetical protein
MATPDTEIPVPDFSVRARRHSERLAIVEHILGTPGLQETDYLEWKTGYDLAKRPGAASTAKQLMAMANRDEKHAVRHAEGYAYVLLGVEPGNLAGVELWDSADIETWISRFAGPDLRYDEHYVQKDGKQVLFLTIDPPNQGDPLYHFREGSEDLETRKTIPEAAIYVRHGSKAEPATSEDIARLTARAAPAADRAAVIHDLSLELDTTDVAVIGARILTDETRDEWLRRWRADMLAKLPKPSNDPYSLGASFALNPIGENRSGERYAQEVDAYVQRVKATPSLWQRIVMHNAIEQGRAKLGLTVRNDSAENYENAVMELTFVGLGRANIYADAHGADELLGIPDLPHEWGVSLSTKLAREIDVPVVTSRRDTTPEVEEVGPGEVLVRYPELRIRPHTPHRLPPLLAALPPHFAGMTIPVHWRMTASNTKSDLADDVEFLIPGDPQEPNAETEQAGEPEREPT